MNFLQFLDNKSEKLSTYLLHHRHIGDVVAENNTLKQLQNINSAKYLYDTFRQEQKNKKETEALL